MNYLDIFAECLGLERIDDSFYRTPTGVMSEQDILNDPIYLGFKDCMNGKKFPLITSFNTNYVKGFCRAGEYKLNQYFREIARQKGLDPDELVKDRKGMITD